jgi:hypothetical protein
MSSNLYRAAAEAISSAKSANLNRENKDPVKVVILEQIALALASLADAYINNPGRK